MFIEMIREAISGGHSVLVFSSFTRMLNLMRSAFKKLGIDYFYLDGATKDRMDLVHRFNAGEAPVFLLSLKAAGTGLTLTQADTVMHYDLWWNPAVEDQATDRAYRIGQKRVVTNYKLITRGTIEEKILELQNKKADVLIDTVVGDSMGDINKLSWDEVKNLIN
ncbi:SWF/SNF helicase family protein [Brachyspira hyodysenteriae]|nr:C-terminal helicase domain-containing protein [Brachyspira hyodysenteriae]MDA1470300.1 SWF/SNF helicase family protein [Brachyspira hyodysenteriae]